ncbi:peptide/nickel transport system substrate-binding protein [Roseomonas rosea]|uniref:Peptide/nickel transport system substrate-binding protein n=1 Tax=Muricoccus roseus TaxID=198092 RepID=A0A1M6Q1U3_9PROT|nr:ABC transporter substrate-binding protein [Roseomonas rosea]SHK14190.1 peptide/nickel transport system substrate-binding protein [Roseomonas rosea]
MTTRRNLLAASGAAFLPWDSLIRAAHAQTPPGVIVMAKQIDDIITLDPAESFEYTAQEIAGNVYQKLVTTPNDEPSRLTGDLAESWTASEDAKTFTFRLKPGQKFSSGREVTAEDVAYSLQRVVALNKSPAFIINQFGFTKDNMAQTIRATDPRTVVLTTAEPTATSFLLYCLSAGVGSIVEKATVSGRAQGEDWGNAWLKGNSAGSGPYSIVSWRASEAVTLQANANSATPPATRRIIMRHVADPSAQLLGLQRGDYDLARNLASDQIKTLSGDRSYTVVSQRKASLLYVAMNQKNPILAKLQVRQAIKMAIDYEGIQRNIVPNNYAVHQAFLPEGLPGALTEKPFKLDVAAAKRLLAEAGHPDGFECSFDFFSGAPVGDIAQALQANLAAIGIRPRMLPGEMRAVITKTRARQHDLALLRWGSDYFDPHSNAEAFSMNPDNGEDARNKTLAWRSSWNIPELTARTLAAVKETDTAKRVAMYEALQREHQQTSPFAVMLQELETAVMRNSLRGMQIGVLSDRTSYATVAKG